MSGYGEYEVEGRGYILAFQCLTSYPFITMNVLTVTADIHYTLSNSSLGLVQVAQTEAGICSIILGDDEEIMKQELEGRFPGRSLFKLDPVPDGLEARVVSYIESPVGAIDVPLDLGGTDFQREVWCALCAIPAGSTLSYTEVAKNIGRPKAVRAVAGACAGNRIAVVIPCHRVVRNDGSISGYRWGVERKRALLEREKVANSTR